MRPEAVRTADPMAKPLPVAAVVFPRASSASVTSRTFSLISGSRSVAIDGATETRERERERKRERESVW
tara:strand:- start:574 stop:780 length:207 start_codon:yes stop_codon:yes gene_type:complete